MADVLISIGIDAVVFASWLFLVSVGLTLVLGVMRILNIAHGSLYALGAYLGGVFVIEYSEHGLWPHGVYLLLVAAALVVGGLIGPAIERGVLRWMYKRDEVLQLLATYSVFLILEDMMKIGFGTDPYFAYQPYGLLGQFTVGGVSYPTYYLLLCSTAAAAGLGLWWFINRTRFGKLVSSVIHDPEMSSALGINLTTIYLVTFSLGAALGALGGAFTAPMISIVPGIGVEVIVLAFAVVVIGGLGRIEGAALGAVVIGVVRTLAVRYMPVIELFAVYLVMAMVLAFRPQGLFTEEVRRI